MERSYADIRCLDPAVVVLPAGLDRPLSRSPWRPPLAKAGAGPARRNAHCTDPKTSTLAVVVRAGSTLTLENVTVTRSLLFGTGAALLQPAMFAGLSSFVAIDSQFFTLCPTLKNIQAGLQGLRVPFTPTVRCHRLNPRIHSLGLRSRRPALTSVPPMLSAGCQ